MPPVGLSPVYPRKPQPTRDCTNCIFYITDCIFLPRPQPAKKRENPQAAVDFARHRAILKINSTGASCPGAERHAERNGISNGKQFQLLFAHRDRLRPGRPDPGGGPRAEVRRHQGAGGVRQPAGGQERPAGQHHPAHGAGRYQVLYAGRRGAQPAPEQGL